MIKTRTRRPRIKRLAFAGYLVGLLLLIAAVGYPPASKGASAPVLVGAGDIATCDSAADEATAALLDQIDGTIFTTGDNAYPMGSDADFRDCYNPSWGRLKDRTRPSAGNHEYYTDTGDPYYDYFGAAAGPRKQGYYSYDLGAWHVVVLNSNIAIDAASEQIEWLRADLAAASTQCTVAYWHHPLFNSGNHGNQPFVRDAWHVLYEFGVDVVVNGHDHNYERFAPQSPDGQADPRGIRQFIVGTGGGSLYQLKELQPNSEIHNDTTFGVLKFTLHPASYDWEFIPVPGGTFRDAGTATCVDGVPSTHALTTTSLSPAAGIAGGSAFTLAVNGTYFSQGSTVQWNGIDRPTTFVNSTLLLATIPGEDLAQPGVASVTVTDSSGTNRSNPQEFTITPAIKDNLLDNGGFEADADNDGQADRWWFNESVKQRKDVVYSGNASMRHYATDKSGNVISQTVDDLRASANYSFSGWVNIPANPLPKSFEFILRIRWRDSNKDVIKTEILQTFKEPTNNWQAINVSLQAPEGTANAQVQMVLNALNGAVYIDDLVLRALPDDTTSTSPGQDNPLAAATPAAIFTDEPTSEAVLTMTPAPAITTPATELASASTPRLGAAEPGPTARSSLAYTPPEAPSTASTTPPDASPLGLGHMLLGAALTLALVFQVIGIGFIIKVIRL